MTPPGSWTARSRSWALIAALLGLMVVVAACGGSQPSSTSSTSSPSSSASAPAPSTSTGSSPSTGSSASQASASGEIELIATDEAGQFRFLPNRIEVRPGQTISLRVVNQGASAHDLALPTLGAETGQIDPGQATTLTLTAPSTPGEYRFICTIPGHEQLGMYGTLVVLP